jgi:integrase
VVKDTCNAFLAHKQALLDVGELTPRTWGEYKAICDLLVEKLGKNRLVDDLAPQDFAALRKHMASRWGPVRLAVVIQIVRSVFKYSYEAGLIDRPLRFGPDFARPSRKVLRRERASKGPRMFEAEEIRRILEAAGPQLRAMVLLGVNCGYGNSDVGQLPLSALDLERGWADYPRPKTGVTRRCPLWPETVAALKEALALRRQEPKDTKHAGLVFLTRFGASWHSETKANRLSEQTRRLLDRLGINGNRNFYALRHTFETIGGESRDQVAVDAIMGHARDDMASVYRERISDARLRAVVDHVHHWLFGGQEQGSNTSFLVE